MKFLGEAVDCKPKITIISTIIVITIIILTIITITTTTIILTITIISLDGGLKALVGSRHRHNSSLFPSTLKIYVNNKCWNYGT